MLCDICKKNVATFHYTEVVGGVKSEHHLCSECAADTDVSYYTTLFDSDVNFTKLLAGILSGQGLKAKKEGNDYTNNVKCPRCGMGFSEFLEGSAFGCTECYEVFKPLISDTIKKIQGSVEHVGKIPAKYRDITNENNTNEPEESGKDNAQINEIDVLTRKLKEAIEIEDFEEAARLRDAIEKLKKEGEGDE